jgi:molecular chaperone DnaK
MQDEAEIHKAEDEKKKDLISAKNAADALIATSEKSLKDGGDNVDAETKTQVEEKIKALKEVMNSDDKTVIEEKTKELSETLQTIGQKLYEAAQKNNPETPKEGEEAAEPVADAKKDGDVEEGEVVS